MTEDELVRLIDRTVLRPEATPDDVRRLCAEALEFRFASVLVSPAYVSRSTALAVLSSSCRGVLRASIRRSGP